MRELSKSIFLISLSLFFCSTFVSAEDITITTYYPSPYGSYKTLNIYNQDESTTQTDFTQALTKAGIVITTDYTADAYTPGIFWAMTNSTPTTPKAGIYLKETGTGTNMYLGTSNNYATGITNNALVIDPTGNVGIVGHVIGTPVTGRWVSTASVAGTGNYTWDTETFNTNSSYLTRADTNTSIQFLIAGYYLISVNALQSTVVSIRGDLSLLKNGAAYVSSLGYGTVDGYIKHSFSEVMYAAANDKITVSCSTGGRYGGGIWSTLSVVRLN